MVPVGLEVDLTRNQGSRPGSGSNFAHYAETLFELRKHKGMTLEKAEEILREDYITYGVMMVKEKIADGLVAGHAMLQRIHKTCSSDFKDSTRHGACFRFLYHGCSGL